MGPDLQAKVRFLSGPAAYPARPRQVRAIETHMSWVFLTDAHAWKLKKPGVAGHRRLASIVARREHCRLELRLNRRLTEGVYLAVVPLRLDSAGRLNLDVAGRTVDWLLQMRRLPGSRMLDRMIGAGHVPEPALHAFVARMAAFYRQARPQPVGGEAWRARLARSANEALRELRRFGALLPQADVEAVAGSLARRLERDAALLEARAAGGRIVEGHGDLRPEHVCLEAVPQVIDCLEFSRALRVVDPLEELAFLSLECARLGAPQLQARLLAHYAELSGDRASPRLVADYQALHALNRAMLALRHLDDDPNRRRRHWIRRARGYLDLARDRLEEA